MKIWWQSSTPIHRLHDYRTALGAHPEGALIMDCNAVLLKTAEGMADLSRSIGLRASRRLLYQGPDRRALEDWMRIYNFRSGPQLKS